MNARSDHHLRAVVVAMCVLVTAAGGAMDAWVYLEHGHVFANAQTGNVVLMSIALARGDGVGAARHLPSLLAFVAGMAVSRLAGVWLKRARLNSRDLRFEVEAALLVGLALVADHWSNDSVTAGVGLIAGLQITALSHVGGWGFNTGMTTGNLRSLVNALIKVIGGSREDRPQVLLMVSIALAFIMGALVGAWLTPRLHGSTLAVIAALIAAVLLAGRRVPDPVPGWDELE